MNECIPRCEENSQMIAPIDDNDDNALTYYINEQPTIVGSQDHNNKSNCEPFRVTNYVEKPPSGEEVSPLTKENGVQEEKNSRSELENEAIGPLKNENIALKSQLQNDKGYRKSLIPCPFLIRRGWCVKGDRCDFQHPTSRRNYHKHNVPCPFLRKNGFCLKANNCNFFHGVFPYPNKRSRPGPVGESHLYNPFSVPHQRPAELIPPKTMQSQPYYSQWPRYVHTPPPPMAETTDGGASLATVSLPHSTCNDNSVLPTLLVTNVRSLFQKIDELQSIAEINQDDIICITESWLTPSCPDSTISLTNFIHFRNDRLFSRGGGVCVYINAGIYCRKLEHFEHPDIESLWIVLRPKRLPRSISIILLAVIYHTSSGADVNSELYNHIQSNIDSFLSHHPDALVYIPGDFNPVSTLPDEKHLKRLTGLTQIIKVPTRSNSILD